jgi:hypothetical protein
MQKLRQILKKPPKILAKGPACSQSLERSFVSPPDFSSQKMVTQKFFARHPRFQFAGHNIREFDIPYICRRALINGLSLPISLQMNNFKPWEQPLLDTMQLWRFGEFRNYTSLKLLAAVMGVPTPKDDIDGSMVGKVYWETGDVQRIADYCQKDVLTVAQLLLKFKGLPLIEKDGISIVA